MSSTENAETGEDRSVDRKDRASHDEVVDTHAKADQRSFDHEFGGTEARAKLEVRFFSLGCRYF